MAEEKSNSIPFIISKIRIGKKRVQDVPTPKSDPNKIKVEVDPLKRPKLSPDELQGQWKANRGSGYHKNPAEKRKNNPHKQLDD
jgi:hypothetical protein